MKKKIVSGLLATTMVASLLFGCGGGDAGTTEAPNAGGDTSASVDEPSTTEETPSVEVTDTGKVLNIYCWNDEFQRRVVAHYPKYEEVDATSGKIGDIEVKWNITPSTDNAYQNNLDETLLKQADAPDDEKIDLFLIEADYALKYVDADVTMPIADLGITDSELANQYQYTKDICTDSNGVLKGLSWQGCPGVLFYNREAAKDILGADDADTVQAAVKDWATFKETAKTAVEKGYTMTSSTNDAYRVYSNNVSAKWVVDGKVQIDSNIMQWVDDSKELVDMKATGTHDLWSDDWNKGFFPEGKVFCYFGPAWLVNFSMKADEEGSIGYNGGWGATEGPQGFFWGGTWICAATGTDNAGTIADIARVLTTDEETMKQIVIDDDDFVNNKPAMEAMAADSSYSSKILGGINPLAMYAAGADKIDMSTQSAYDQGCNEEFQKALTNYFNGNATKEEAIENFKKAIVEKYPELTVE